MCDGGISVLRLQLHQSWVFRLYQKPMLLMWCELGSLSHE